jgi:glycosyltransferase involved in cell wall biosynthesis
MITACLIVQDEEECLVRALDSVDPYVDEIVVVDGGSKDKTREIALQYAKAKLFEIAFPRDFAQQKNNAIELASGDWILFLDADEYYMEYVGKSLPLLVDNGEFDAFSFSRKTFIDDRLVNPLHEDRQIRFFRSYCRYEGTLHECIGNFEKLGHCNLDIMHYKTREWQQKDNELYWDMGQEPPPGWQKIDGNWTWVGIDP